MLRLVRWGSLGILVLVAMAATSRVVFAANDPTLKSAHYQFENSDLGGGGISSSSSPSYQTVLSTQDAAIGHSGSTNYQNEAGSQTTGDPALTFTVNGSGASFGSFSPTQAATATSTFSVSDYTSYGYIVIITGTPPTYGTHTITPMGTDADGGPQASSPGVDQFGVNVVKNTSPTNFGADPDHGQFGIGNAATNYDTDGKFRYVDGDTIAVGPKSSGVTTYTISYLVNVNSLTPGGEYQSDLSLICIATY